MLHCRRLTAAAGSTAAAAAKAMSQFDWRRRVANVSLSRRHRLTHTNADHRSFQLTSTSVSSKSACIVSARRFLRRPSCSYDLWSWYIHCVADDGEAEETDQSLNRIDAPVICTLIVRQFGCNIFTLSTALPRKLIVTAHTSLYRIRDCMKSST